jgi:hypothetical protein
VQYIGGVKPGLAEYFKQNFKDIKVEISKTNSNFKDKQFCSNKSLSKIKNSFGLIRS